MLVIILIGIIVVLPYQASQTFGPPGVSLSNSRLLTYSLVLLYQARDLTETTNPDGIDQPFEIRPGESVASITHRLTQEGLITNPVAFQTYLQYTGMDTTIQAGEYILNPAMPPIQIAHTIQSSISTQVTFVILAGWRVEEIARSLPTSGLEITPEAFLESINVIPPGFSFSGNLPVNASLEGFLFPEQYEVLRSTTLDELYSIIFTRFDENVTTEIRRGFKKQQLSLYEAVILASMVQREAVQEDEMPLIASVFYNRLETGMKLESDPTVQYALGYQKKTKTWWKNPLSLDDLQVDSPYNTYLHKDLPPGPISNPGLNALKAVAFPANTPYYYFRAACDSTGTHLFAKTLEEHIQNSCP